MLGLVDRNREPLDSLVPIADFFNHDSKYTIEWNYMEKGDKKGFFMHAVRDISRGEQVYGNYGSKPNY